MRYIWFSPPPGTQTPGQAQSPEPEQSASAETREEIRKPEDLAKDLDDYLKAFEKEKIDEKEKKEREEFMKKLDDWDANGNVEALRTGGATEREDLQDYLSKHKKLSAAFLEREGGAGVTFKVDFRGNQTAYWKVGAGDILPPNVTKIKVTKPGGEVIEGTRGFHPQTRRIGYFDAGGNYIPVFTGDTIEITETVDPKQTQAQRKILAEHVEIYQNGAAHDTASIGAEALYDAETKTVFESEEQARNFHRDRIAQEAQEARQGLTGEVLRPRGAGAVEVAGKKLPKYGRTEWIQLCGNNAAAAEKWIIRRDPVTGGAAEFFGQRIGGGVNMTIFPFLKEAEERIKAANISYQVKGPSSFNWRNVRGGSTLSMHSWGVAIDINVATNQMGVPGGDMPMEIVQIMESLGFAWGGRWKGKSYDPMHFEFRANPFAAKELLTGIGKQYWQALEPNMDAASPRIRPPGTMTRENQAGSGAPSVAPATGPARSLNMETGDIANRRSKNLQEIALDHAHNAKFMKVSEDPSYKRQINSFKSVALKNRARYEAVAAKADVPWTLIAAIHYREGSNNFKTYLHNGDPLGKPTTHVPKGKLFYDWESAAIDALGPRGGIKTRIGVSRGTNDLGKILAYAEAYNGLGYRNARGKTSPYVYAGTNIYQGGMYVKDGVYNPNVNDKRLGVAACILALQNA